MREKLFCLAILAGTFLASGPSVRAANDHDKHTMTVTGCLTRGTDTNQFMVTDSGGAVTLLNDRTDLTKHLNHTVKVTVEHSSDDANKPVAERHDHSQPHTVKKIEHVANTCASR